MQFRLIVDQNKKEYSGVVQNRKTIDSIGIYGDWFTRLTSCVLLKLVMNIAVWNAYASRDSK
jgi:hypothetical protein